MQIAWITKPWAIILFHSFYITTYVYLRMIKKTISLTIILVSEGEPAICVGEATKLYFCVSNILGYFMQWCIFNILDSRSVIKQTVFDTVFRNIKYSSAVFNWNYFLAREQSSPLHCENNYGSAKHYWTFAIGNSDAGFFQPCCNIASNAANAKMSGKIMCWQNCDFVTCTKSVCDINTSWVSTVVRLRMN